MVIGKGGANLRQVGEQARLQLPPGTYLELRVKVDKDWQRRPDRVERSRLLNRRDGRVGGVARVVDEQLRVVVGRHVLARLGAGVVAMQHRQRRAVEREPDPVERGAARGASGRSVSDRTIWPISSCWSWVSTVPNSRRRGRS